MNTRNNEAMSTEDFLRQVVFNNGGRGGEIRFRQVARPFAEQAVAARPVGRQAGVADGEYGQRAPSGGGPERGSASAGARGRGAGNIPALFRIRCRTNNRGKLTAKEEGVPGNVRSWEYAFAPKGHLVKALCNGRVEEEYAYNEAGQRVRDSLRHLGRERRFRYNRQGRLVEADGIRYYYAGDGSLRCKEEGRRSTYYEYGKDSRLDAARLPSGDTITYGYGNSLLPERILWDGRPVAAYQWQGPLQLARFHDLHTDTVYTFHYEGGRLPVAVTVAGEMTRSLVRGTGTGTGGMALSLAWGQAQPGRAPGEAVTLRLGTDQVGSVRTLSDGNGILIKEIAYDSFGNVTRDTLPRFFFPLGFAGGLTDPHTGFIRFGFRDYDPSTGRFTAKDPLGDTGGDHDLYDYCVDDPVSFVDPEGLEAQGIAGQGQRADTGASGIPGFWERNLPFWFAHKNDAIRQGIIDMVKGKQDEAPQASSDAEKALSEIRLFPFFTTNHDARYEKDREALIRGMHKASESWGRDMLGTHLITINGRTRGVSDAIINKDLTKITDPLLEEIAEGALKAGRRGQKKK